MEGLPYARVKGVFPRFFVHFPSFDKKQITHLTDNERAERIIVYMMTSY